MSRRWLLPAVVAGAVIAMASTAWASSAVPQMKGTLKIAYIYVGPIGDSGYTYQQDVARKYIKSHFKNVQTSYIENVPQGPQVQRVETEYALKGYNIIFATAFGYQPYTLKVAKQFPNVIIENASGFETAPNAGTYYGKLWEARYLTGVVAGKLTKSNVIGFVGAYPIPAVITGIDGFAAGVASVNKKAIVKVVWTNSWFNPPTEKASAQSLVDAGADVVAQHQDSPSSLEAAAQKGAWAIGSESDMCHFAAKKCLTGTMWNWIPFETSVIKAARAGTFRSSQYWGTFRNRGITLAPFGSAVPAKVRALVNKDKAAFNNGSLNVFRGPIKDNAGKMQVKAGHTLSLTQIQKVTWLMPNVRASK